MNQPYRVLVVGAGPRGLSAVERLVANYAATLSTSPLPNRMPRPMEIIWVDPYEHGPGHVWQREQSELYLMNTPAEFPTAVPTATGTPVGLAPSLVPYSFEQWRQLSITDPHAVVLAPEVRREAAALHSTDYPSRRLYGHYLYWVRERLLGALPAGVQVQLVRGEVTALEENDGAWVASVDQVESGGAKSMSTLRADAVVLALGHVPAQLGPEQTALAEHARQHGGVYFGPQVPLDEDWERVAPGTTVLVRGMGLNFFDILGQLTQGRGGTFVPDDRRADRLRYLPSGREPHIVAGARRGTPYLAKAQATPVGVQIHSTQAQEAHMPTGRELLPELAAYLDTVLQGGESSLQEGESSQRAVPSPQPGRTKLSFEDDLWPHIAHDLRQNGWLTDEAATAGTDTDGADTAGSDTAGSDTDALRRSLLLFASPMAKSAGTTPGEHRPERYQEAVHYQEAVREHLNQDISRALAGEGAGANKAVATLNASRYALKSLVATGALNESSWHHELRGWFESLVESVASGPPAVRIQQLLALMEAGVVEVLGPEPHFEPLPLQEQEAGAVPGVPRPDLFQASSPHVPGATYRASAMIEAMMPANRVSVSAAPLLATLLGNGTAGVYRWQGENGAEYVGSGLDADRSTLQVRGRDGERRQHLFALGLQLSSVRWGTAIAAEAHSEWTRVAPSLNDADVIARQVVAEACGDAGAIAGGTPS